MKQVFFTLIFLCLYTFAFSQTKKDDTYNKGKIYLKDNRILSVKTLQITDEEVNFLHKENLTKGAVDLTDVKLIRVPKGNYAGRGALYGGGLMTLSAIYALIKINSDPYVEPKENAGAILLGFIVGGTLVGALIGSASPKWATIYPKKNNSASSNKINYKAGISASTKHIGLSLRIGF
ncbi:hypothetical protein QQ008_08255 [Fulvivirgaceae bacterium BMA10]|uniref:Uncharacterized protein n=1 Tax=Splendidivirga corallicola TaxID=3051826 RepID=A0ABT8KKV6_9BACT|nr:hypothetical protein [Fulvivirgaceae bacterium BMA10]